MNGNDGYQVLLTDLDGRWWTTRALKPLHSPWIHREFFAGRLGLAAFTAAFRARNSELWAAYRRHETTLEDLRTERFRRLRPWWPGTHPPATVPRRLRIRRPDAEPP